MFSHEIKPWLTETVTWVSTAGCLKIKTHTKGYENVLSKNLIPNPRQGGSTRTKTQKITEWGRKLSAR